MAAYVATRGAASNAPITNRGQIGVPVIIESEYQFGAAVAPAINDTIDVCYWPAGYVLEPDLCRVRFEELDSNAAPTGTLDVGIDGNLDLIFDGVALGGTEAYYNHAPNLIDPYNAAASDEDRLIIATVKTAVATGVVAKKIVFKMAFRPAHA
jgi:hypothetical protein